MTSETTITPTYKRVMVIDDNNIDLYIAERNLKRNAFAEEIILKGSAKSALEYLNDPANIPELLPQVIFLDIRMPDIDGFGFLDEYKKLAENIKTNCIIMMLSSSLDENDHKRAKDNIYVSGFLNKPLNPEKLKDIKI